MAAVRPAGPDPMIRTLDSVRPSVSVGPPGPPARGAARASVGPSLMIAIPPPNGFRLAPVDGLGAGVAPFAVPLASPPPKLIPSEPKAFFLPLVLSVMVGLSSLSGPLSCLHRSTGDAYPPGVSIAPATYARRI